MVETNLGFEAELSWTVLRVARVWCRVLCCTQCDYEPSKDGWNALRLMIMWYNRKGVKELYYCKQAARSVRIGEQCIHNSVFWHTPAPIPLNLGDLLSHRLVKFVVHVVQRFRTRHSAESIPNMNQNIYSWMPASVLKGRDWYTLSELDSMAVWCPGIGWWASSSVSYTCLFSSSHSDADALIPDPMLQFFSICCRADFEYKMFRSIEK